MVKQVRYAKVDEPHDGWRFSRNTSTTHRAEAGEDQTEQMPDANPALLPDELLQPGEVVILLLKPSLLYVVLACLKTLAILGVLTLAGMYIAEFGWVNVAERDVLTAGLGLIFLRIFWQFLEWLSRIYVLTDRRIIRVKGVITVQVFECPLKQIQHTQAIFTLRERLFGLGTIGFSTAGTGLPEAYWLMISNPLEAHQTIVKTMNRYT